MKKRFISLILVISLVMFVFTLSAPIIALEDEYINDHLSGHGTETDEFPYVYEVPSIPGNVQANFTVSSNRPLAESGFTVILFEEEHIHDQSCVHDASPVPCEDRNPDDYLYRYEIADNFFVNTNHILDEAAIEEYRQSPEYRQLEEALDVANRNSCSHSPGSFSCVGNHKTVSSTCCCYHIHCLRPTICTKCGVAYSFEVFESGVDHVWGAWGPWTLVPPIHRFRYCLNSCGNGQIQYQ